MSYKAGTCDCSFSFMCNPNQCRTCPELPLDSSGNIAITQKRIWYQVRAPASIYMMNLAALTVAADEKNLTESTAFVNWNQMSDRVNPHSMQFQNHPSRGNSTKKTLTSLKPGACSPGGRGVDVKHDSYARYLARKKASNIRTQSDKPAASTPRYGNKTKMYGMITNSQFCGKTTPCVTDDDTQCWLKLRNGTTIKIPCFLE